MLHSPDSLRIYIHLFSTFQKCASVKSLWAADSMRRNKIVYSEGRQIKQHIHGVGWARCRSYISGISFFNFAQLLRATAKRQKPWERGDGASYHESSQSARSDSESKIFFFQMFADVGIFLAVFFMWRRWKSLAVASCKNWALPPPGRGQITRGEGAKWLLVGKREPLISPK